MNSTFNADYADITDSVTPCQILSLNYAAQNQSDFPIRARGVGFGAAPTTAGGAGPGNVGLSFIVILPRTKEGLSALEKNLDTDQLATWIGKMTLNRMNVFLPKFKVEQSYDLNTGLQALGITDAFVNPFTHPNDPNSADFSGMNGVRQFFIAKAVHQTYLNVDEKGTEAAAATAIMVGAMGAGMPPKSVLFRADHPFLFIIRENSTGCILFLGRLASPP
jgi:serpin B